MTITDTSHDEGRTREMDDLDDSDVGQVFMVF
jgi:hypothetical protein